MVEHNRLFGRRCETWLKACRNLFIWQGYAGARFIDGGTDGVRFQALPTM